MKLFIMVLSWRFWGKIIITVLATALVSKGGEFFSLSLSNIGEIIAAAFSAL